MTAGTSENLMTTERILVLGLGNVLLKDEGLGVHIARRLQKQRLPLQGNTGSTGSAQVEIIDGGTAGSDILLSQRKPYKLVIVDAVKAGKKPGTVYKARLEAGEIDKLAGIFSRDGDLKIGPHQFGLIDALADAQMCNCAPREIVIIGVEPKEINCGLELTEQISRKIPEVVNAVLEEI